MADLVDGVLLTKHPLRAVWSSMVQRCYNPKCKSFGRYGGRGIGVSDQWRFSSLTFVQWALANGWRKGLLLDRIDNDGAYSPVNCQFVTYRESNLNRRNTIRLADGRAAAAVAVENGISRKAMLDRYRRGGWSLEQAVSVPVGSERPVK